jgi:hypothetical protein
MCRQNENGSSSKGARTTTMKQEENMKKTWKSSVLLIGTAMLGAVALSGMNAMAGDVTMTVDAVISSTLSETVTTELDFGTVDLSPGGDTLTLDASAGAATFAAGGSSTAVGATSGLVTVSSPNGFTITLTYPVSVALTGSGSAAGGTLTITSIGANSVGGVTPVVKSSGVAPASDALIHVGGEIIAPSGTLNGPYTGSMTITLNYS